MDYRGDPATEYLCHVSYKKARFRKAITSRNRNSAARHGGRHRELVAYVFAYELIVSLTYMTYRGTIYRNNAHGIDKRN